MVPMMWQGYKGLLSIPKENKELLDQLAQGRLHLAHLFSQGSYADYALDALCLAGRPAAVTGFLHNLNTALQPQVTKMSFLESISLGFQILQSRNAPEESPVEHFDPNAMSHCTISCML